METKIPPLPTHKQCAEQALRIMEGEEPPVSDTMAFIAMRAREARERGDQLLGVEQRLKAQLAGVQRGIAETHGALQQYREDVELLLEKHHTTPEEPEKEGQQAPDENTPL